MKGDTLYLQKFSYFNKDSGLEHIFIEQEEYYSTPFESIQYNMQFMKTL
jgi:hypothetical protein